MKFTCEHAFAAPVERVLAMYCHPDFIPAKYAALGLRDVTRVSGRQDASGFEVTYRFLEQASIDIPAMARKFVGDSDWLAANQTDRWDVASRTGQLVVVIESFQRVTSIRCDMRLEPTATGCVNRMTWEVTCSVPLIGGTLAKFIADDIQRKSARDGDVAQQLLTSQY